jgi:hypothetical protein
VLSLATTILAYSYTTLVLALLCLALRYAHCGLVCQLELQIIREINCKADPLHWTVWYETPLWTASVVATVVAGTAAGWAGAATVIDAVSGRAGQEGIGGDREEGVLQSVRSPARASFDGVGMHSERVHGCPVGGGRRRNQYGCAAFIVQVAGGRSAVLVDVAIPAPLLASGRCPPADIL